MIKLHIERKKGLTLIELLLYIALLGIILPIMTSILMYGFDTYNTNVKFIKQEDMISNVSHLLRKDVEKARRIEINSTNNEMTLYFYDGTGAFTQKKWKFDNTDNTLKVNDKTIIKNIDANNSSFKTDLAGASSTLTSEGKTLWNNGTLILTLKPIETNKKKSQNRNFTKPIITEFSVRYKEIA
jgi:type II secretory pathway pseudopilin PulG